MLLIFFTVALYIYKAYGVYYPTAQSIDIADMVLHASTGSIINETVYVYGGSMIGSNSNKLFSISFDEYGFIHYNNVNDQGPRVAYHQAVVLPGNNSFIVFGGFCNEFFDADGPQPIFAEIYSFSQNKWSILPGLNQTVVPLNRQQHSAIIASNGLIYIYGGIELGLENRNILKDSWVYNPLAQAFIKLSSPPLGLYGCSATALPDNRIVYVGGFTTDDDEYSAPFYLNRAIVYYTNNDTWSEQELNTQAIHFIDRYNMSRKGASAVLGPEGRYIYYFGGTNGFTGYDAELFYNNILILDTQSWTWGEPEILGIKPTHRSETIGVRLNNEYVLFGFGTNNAYVYSEVNFLRLPSTANKKEVLATNSDTLSFESLKWVNNITTGKTYYEQYSAVIPSGISKSAVIAIAIVCGLVVFSG